MCWAFSSNAVVESTYLIEGGPRINLSEKHMAYGVTRKIGSSINPFGFYIHEINENGVDIGGNIEYSGAYYVQRRGPILETKFPFSKTIFRISISSFIIIK